MAPFPNAHTRIPPRRKKVFFLGGFQLRYTALVAGSLLVLLVFAGLHGLYIADSYLPADIADQIRLRIQDSTWRLFVVGIVYVSVVTMAAVFLSHRAVGPTHRLVEEIDKAAESGVVEPKLKVREGDEFEDLVKAVNRLIERSRLEK